MQCSAGKWKNRKIDTNINVDDVFNSLYLEVQCGVNNMTTLINPLYSTSTEVSIAFVTAATASVARFLRLSVRKESMRAFKP